MIRTTVQISGMVCGMCEAHVNDAVRSAFQVKKVSSSRSKGETVIESEKPLDHEKLRQIIMLFQSGMISIIPDFAVLISFIKLKNGLTNYSFMIILIVHK